MSGGILLGVRAESMHVLASSDGEFYVKLHIHNKADNFTWTLVALYGAAQDES
jgi:DNA topoisomerase VI subunit A